MLRLALRCNASHSGGMGHLVRQLHLARLLRGRGDAVTFFVPDHPPSLRLLNREGFAAEIVAPDAALPGSHPGGFDGIVLDLGDTDSDFIRSLRPRCRFLVDFEDLGPGRDHVDLLVDANLDPDRSRELPEPVWPLFGPAYSVLAPEYASLHLRSRSFPPFPQTVLVTLGGTDPHGLTVRLGEALVSVSEKVSVTLVAGPGFQEGSRLQVLARACPSFKVLTGVGSLADLLFTHDLVFCSGGITLHEALAAGTPALVINQVSHQEEKARTAEQFGAAVNLGLAEEFQPQKIEGFLKTPRTCLEKMSRAGKDQVDGKGIFRVLEAILEWAGRRETGRFAPPGKKVTP